MQAILKKYILTYMEGMKIINSKLQHKIYTGCDKKIQCIINGRLNITEESITKFELNFSQQQTIHNETQKERKKKNLRNIQVCLIL